MGKKKFYKYIFFFIRILKKGGRFLCLELSHVEAPVFKQLLVFFELVLECLWYHYLFILLIVFVFFFGYRYDYYSFSVIPVVGELVAGDRDSYQYLVESVRRFPPQVCFMVWLSVDPSNLNENKKKKMLLRFGVIDLQEVFASMIADAGFQKVEYENLVGGVVAIHSGVKF